MAASQVLPRRAIASNDTMRRWRKQLPNYLFILPHLVLFVIFLAWPIFRGIQISLYDWKIMLPPDKQAFVGLKNYNELLANPLWWTVLGNTVRFAIMTMIGNVALSLGVAVALKQNFRGRNLFRILFFATSILSVSVLNIVMGRVWDPLRGLLNYFLVDVFNLPRVQWLGNPLTVLPALSVTTIWWSFGFPMLAFLTGLQNIPDSIYEAAKIDGAGGRQTFTKITLPLITPTMLFVLVTQFIAHMQMFAQAYVLTAGGPGNESRSVVIYLYETAWKFFRLGYASSIAVALAVIMIVVTFIQFFILRNRTDA